MTILFDPLAWPALIKVLCCFVLVVAATRFKVNLGVCLAGAGLLLGLWMGLTPSAALSAGLAALAEPWALRLGLLVGLILVLSHLMKQAGQLERIVKMFSTLVRSPKVVAGVMPALIGLLPMPGGALFSAPMVEASCPDLGKGGEQGALLATVNYWFRHHGEYWWPLYPGVILAVALLKVEMAFYVLMMMPLAVVHLAGGSWFLLRRIKGQAAAAPGPPQLAAFLLACAPIILVVLAVPCLSLLAALWTRSTGQTPWPEGTPLTLGLAAAVIQVVIANRIPLKKLAGAFWRRELLAMMSLVAGIMVFQGLLKSSGAVVSIQSELIHYGIPTLAMIAILPFISGLVTGVAVAYVATSFPLVVPLFSDLTGMEFMAHAMLAYVCGYFGMMLSPLHLCILLSKDYFKCSLGSCYPGMAAPLGLSALALVGWYLVLA